MRVRMVTSDNPRPDNFGAYGAKLSARKGYSRGDVYCTGVAGQVSGGCPCAVELQAPSPAPTLIPIGREAWHPISQVIPTMTTPLYKRLGVHWGQFGALGASGGPLGGKTKLWPVLGHGSTLLHQNHAQDLGTQANQCQRWIQHPRKSGTPSGHCWLVVGWIGWE